MTNPARLSAAGLPAWPELLLITALTLLALALRVMLPLQAPLGWRDDELSSALVVSQQVLGGEPKFYYPDASGHEGLYQVLQAATLAAFGPGVWGIRGPSMLLGVLGVPLTYLLAHRLFGARSALIAAALLAVSFWSLVYSRTGQRHISVTVTTLIAFYCLWRAFEAAQASQPAQWPWWIGAGAALGLGFYTYFASRGVPLIVIAWGGWLFLFDRSAFRRAWIGLGTALGVSLLLAGPLIWVLTHQPEAETRVSEVAKPLHDAAAGDFSTLAEYAYITASMFTHHGDEEVLYNIPERPVFALLGGLLLWAGMIAGLAQVTRSPAWALLLLWWAAGLAPGVLSVPAASLGHCILALPPTMILAALGLEAALNLAGRRGLDHIAAPALIIVLLGWEGLRGPLDYFTRWADDGFYRVLHHSDIRQAAPWLRAQMPGCTPAIGSFLIEEWDQQAALIDTGAVHLYAFDPRWAHLHPARDACAVIPAYLLGDAWQVDALGQRVPVTAGYALYRLAPPPPPPAEPLAHYHNGLSLEALTAGSEPGGLAVITTWRAQRPLDLPPFPLMAKPPAPGQDNRPRLALFIHLLDQAGERIDGADGLGIDPYTLRAGDAFTQRLVIPVQAAGEVQLAVGLYNPVSGQRVPLEGGADRLLIDVAVP